MSQYNAQLLRRIVLLFTVIFSLAAFGSDVVQIPATDPAVSYVGRWGTAERSGQTVRVTVNSSSQIDLTFTGQHVAGLFDLDGIDDLEEIDVNVDGGAWSLFTIDKQRIEFFPAGLPAGRHQLEIAVKALEQKGNRWLPPLRSAVIFRGFELDPGAKVEPNPTSGARPLLHFLGDSITQGDGVLRQDAGSVINSDSLSTYAWLAGEALETRHAQITFARQGVISSDSREVPPAPLTFAWNFAGSAADFSAPPDFVVINLGTYDEQFSSDEFIAAYLLLLREIRKDCPRAHIFAMTPFQGERFHGDDIAEAVKRMADPAVVYIDSRGWLEKGDYTDGLHPNVVGSRKAAARLEEILKPYVSR